MIIYICPETDTDYLKSDGKVDRFQGKLSENQIRNVIDQVNLLPEFVKDQTDGMCDLELDVVTVDRPVNLIFDSKKVLGFTPPVGLEAEDRKYNQPNPHDSTIVIFNPGPIPQGLRGAGGGNRESTWANITYGTDSNWDPKTPKEFHLAVFVHEWLHGIDGFYGNFGYRAHPLHHLYPFGYDTYWHSGILQGILMVDGDRRYGYSRAAWSFGSPKNHKTTAPVQLSSPPSGATFLKGSKINLRWSGTKAEDGYRVMVYQNDRFGVPIKSEIVKSSFFESTKYLLDTSGFSNGKYFWTVQSIGGKKSSNIGDVFEFNISISDSKTIFELNGNTIPELIPQKGGGVKVNTSVSSASGVSEVFFDAESLDSSGKTDRHWRTFLQRSTPNPYESMYQGNVWFPANLTRKPIQYRITAKAIDFSGRLVQGKSVLSVQGIGSGVRPGSFPSVNFDLEPLVLDDQREITHIGIDGDSAMTLQCKIDGVDLEDSGSNTWIEIQAPDTNNIDFVVMTQRLWDGNFAPLQGIYRFSPNKSEFDRIWKLRIGYRNLDGTSQFSEWYEKTQPGQSAAFDLDGSDIYKLANISGGKTEMRRIPTDFVAKSQLFWAANKGETIEVKFNIPIDGYYDLKLGTAMWDDNGKIQTVINGSNFGSPLNLYSTATTHFTGHMLSGIHMEKGINKIKFEVVSPDNRSRGSVFGLNRLVISKSKNDNKSIAWEPIQLYPLEKF